MIIVFLMNFVDTHNFHLLSLHLELIEHQFTFRVD
jgi:hypothetical protein